MWSLVWILLYGCHSYWSYGAHRIMLLPGGAYSQGTMTVPMLGLHMPKEKHYSIKKLMRKLGKSFDGEWMSIDEPETPNTLPDTGTISDIIEENTLREAVRGDIARTVPEYLDSNKMVDRIATFLSRLSTCRVMFEWEDQGSLFWPRWIRIGTCVSRAYCSWPPSMACVSEAPKTLHVLRWRCKRKQSSKKRAKENCSEGGTDGNRGVRRGKTKCNWKKVPFQVISRCVCTC